MPRDDEKQKKHVQLIGTMPGAFMDAVALVMVGVAHVVPAGVCE